MREKIRLLLNIVLVIAIPGVWLGMVLRWGEGNLLTAAGFSSLKYFTVLSNLLAALAALVFVVSYLRANRRAGNRSPAAARTGIAREDISVPRDVEVLKYVATVAVGLTFFVVLVFLGPLYGYAAMFLGANLYLHLVFPMAAMLEVVFFASCKPSGRDNLLALLPVTAYAVYYVLNMVINGIGEWPDTNDWYGFLNWGIGPGVVITAAAFGITYLIGLVLRKAARG